MNEKRGGYCYELNGLFSFLLKEIGFKVKYLVARSMYGYTEIRPRTHMLLLVEIENQPFIADLGFTGMSLLEPMRLECNTEVGQYTEKFRLLEDETLGFILQLQLNGEWVSLYSFDLHEQMYIDFELANFFNSNSAKSVFTNKVICTKYTPDGRIRLIDNVLKIRMVESQIDKRIESVLDYARVLKDYFRIFLKEDETDKLYSIISK